MDLFVGIDMGTGSTKGVLVTEDGVVLASEQRAHEMSLPRPGWAEVDAEAVWWADVCAIASSLTAEVPAGSRVAAMCVSGVGPCLVLTDADLNPVRSAILYGIDSRAHAEIAELTALFGEAEILRRCGKLLSSQAVGPKIEWVRKNEPENFARASKWFGSNSYVVAKLTGEYIQDHHTASQCDPLYSVREFGWNTEWSDRVLDGLDLPRLAWPSEIVGKVSADAAASTGIPVGTPVVAGTVDAYAEAFSVGVRHPGDLMLMYGSTMFLVQVLAEYRTPAPTGRPAGSTSGALWTTTGVEKGTYALAAGTSTAGSLTTWLQTVTGGASFDELMREASAVPAGSDGLLVLPYLAGERTPVFDPDARGVMAGLTLRHTRGHMFRAAYEGISFGIRQILEMFDDSDTPVTRAVAVGGGLRSPVWAQALSDITGRTQLVPTQAIGASYGDGLLAAIGVGAVSPETDWATVASEIPPNPEHKALYDDLYGNWCELYPSTRKIVHAGAQLTR
ncbi:FGGY-family carbohydrate kinase [Rhodococcus sp. BP-252]|uniref:FGGY-family carbohydrate kinase n=1 Tax=unclassified Rhodococcus (in: high G+C Gram-positive bacteria) TaxID=192944 RepID=UPI001C9A8218|nr:MULTISPECIES: FGGY-family carbohydrate kinase [unclassified Rhodococcus (in: high G+C Gram-positive bacteria)]MBY6413970.1 FGGY-family carbohydrate kinase [Rhodococcus sp. BP-320]MBY6418797.1 FGGY-family carbohydrate kinase [Rhodococcus sp. BP-321]MBY6423322.1 FGGY-family carbohydrate kinase [Rhodococcus sp. BP-324]MBY6428832.1 FGGY-family carbohydrate kinase [Rhodococcus sp. BP-323]MBY6433838.1 FGGY-family carbohydrate kinase [Rhodococcus sp. BP-322]